MRTFLMYSLPILILAVMVFAIYYLSTRIAWAFGISRLITLLVVGTITVGSFVAMMVIMNGNYTSTLSHIVSNITNIAIGALMFAVCIVLLLDLVNLFVKIQPLMFGYIALTLTVIVTLYSLWNANNTKVYHVDISLPNLVEPMRIAHLSDTHFGHFWGEKSAAKLANLIKKESVDAVVITGDMFDGRVRFNNDIVKPFLDLNIPIYFSEGNHDGYSGSREIKELLTKNGIIVLENEKTDLNGLQIIGLDYLIADNETFNPHGSHNENTIQSIFPTIDIDKNRASILLHHNPVGAEYAAENGINLYLAGHTHAGQLFPATIVAGWMFEYNKGLYKYDDNMQIYVSQGAGTFGPPMRLGTESELTIINLSNR
ncbi:MAG: metallophosphoesterase [Bacteroidales bacterium]